ncbi:MAG: hypothetical protein A2527_05540 [Candidatus Lambdaproteobacteria bacterium RIFOXYD2_FULL_50_16]|uniref:Cytochrome c domain-containing protein n=1 Tax=Candidatus Lambdaproteobacteria bacterium RIFOXYD2_FULL_50_16 TaxID=1817772 RepID=A0A1F6G955_9PROT|nr:MAG: hypothetical protein A2527_05540 [Candidatus Lambdaproteobacteria bacterium RIFOXYD2_FULL_50_16]
MFHRLIILLFFSSFLILPAFADAPRNEELNHYLSELGAKAKKEDPSFKGFDPSRGKEVYFKEHLHSQENEKRSCVTCHTKDPSLPSKHASTGKRIKPLSPIVNRERFTDSKKIEKWFKRNCHWTHERPCTTLEKGDFIEYIFSL